MTDPKPRIAILGAGPTGLEAALAASEAGHPFTVYEAAPRVAGHIRDWGHVRLFTPWELDVSARMRSALEQAGRTVPDGGDCPTGAGLVETLLQPISELPALSQNIRCGVRVKHLGRAGLLKHEEIGTGRRSAHAFRLLLEDGTGREWTEEADVVIDCTGNTQPNPLGDGGIPAPGEESAAGTVGHRIPDLAEEADAWAGRTVLVIGAGTSAQTAVVDLVELATTHPDTRVVWALRDAVPQPDPDDPLPQRAGLIGRAAGLAAEPPPCLTVCAGVVVDALTSRPTTDGTDATTSQPATAPVDVKLRHADGRIECLAVDRILAMTGKVGDHLLYRQLQVHECWATSGPMKLAAALMAQSGDSGDCLDQTSLGPETLLNPEPGFFILGSKSYGRRSDFLMRVGWEQVAEVFELLGAD